jgi:WG containing repeat
LAEVSPSLVTFGFIDKTGKEIITLDKYDLIWCSAFIKEGFIGVKNGDKKGFVDMSGNRYFDF